MKKLILILGGARSGKSSYAVELAKEFKKKVVFIATATSSDEEMAKRIALHRDSRPKQWELIEEGKDLVSILPALKDKYEVVLIDCLGLLVSNLLADDLTDDEIEKRIKKLVEAILKIDITTIVVSNEVGSGIVPMNALARRFRDLLGLSNQMIAKEADEVIFMQVGIPVIIKDGQKDAEIE
jgi:adenosylcobinamide kinase/adenosylcobinamide-phosphate guanylyltransferase